MGYHHSGVQPNLLWLHQRHFPLWKVSLNRYFCWGLPPFAMMNSITSIMTSKMHQFPERILSFLYASGVSQLKNDHMWKKQLQVTFSLPIHYPFLCPRNDNHVTWIHEKIHKQLRIFTTVGNVPSSVGQFAQRDTKVVKGSLVGSIISNLLLVLGSLVMIQRRNGISESIQMDSKCNWQQLSILWGNPLKKKGGKLLRTWKVHRSNIEISWDLSYVSETLRKTFRERTHSAPKQLKVAGHFTSSPNCYGSWRVVTPLSASHLIGTQQGVDEKG